LVRRKEGREGGREGGKEGGDMDRHGRGDRNEGPVRCHL
jgi:hypothetical protein